MTALLLDYSSKLYLPAYDDPINLLKQVRRAQFYGKITPVIYQNVPGGKTDEYGGYVGFYGHVIPPILTSTTQQNKRKYEEEKKDS